MGTHIQRKKFEHPELAQEAAKAFTLLDPSIPGATVKAVMCEVEGEYWVYVTQQGNLVTGGEPLLPDYELVS